MEPEVSDGRNPFAVEGNNLALDLDLYDSDSYGILDPGLLKEKNEPSFSELIPQLVTRSSRWKNMTPSARARQLWFLLRTSLHSFVEKEKKSELRVARLTHGLEPLRRLEVAAGLCSVAQDPEGSRFVVLDRAGCLHLHREDGWAQEKLLAPVALTGLVAVLGPLGSVGRFVGWGPAGLAILRPDLSLLWLSEPKVGRAPHCEPIYCLPVPTLELLLVAEAGGSLGLWKFRLGGRSLVPCGSPLQPPSSSTGMLPCLTLGPLPPHGTPRCYAAYGSAVLTFDLHTWAVIDVSQDLHKTIISDLAYCREVEALVTASRDSTVKVWEADWQIRMVFVGHTGPVTALAVLPNTSLVLSASQDGTLRTWDLEAVAQVGEVMLNCGGRDVWSGCVNRLLAPARSGWPVLSLRTGSVELWRLRELYSPLAQLSAQVLHVQVAPALPLPLPLPARIVCACADGSVYLVSVATGRTVNALLLPPEDCAAAVAYCLPHEVLWLLTRAGHLVCANTARCPMCVLYRMCPPPAPAPRPCCLHLYSHLKDPSSAFASWEMVRQHKGGQCRRSFQTWKDKNWYLPFVGHTDGTLSVLEWSTSKAVFHTEAHSPGPVTAIASTQNRMVSSGGDLTVKVWRVFPYAEESLSLLQTLSCCHPAPALCVLGKCVTVAFEDPDSATYGLVQINLGNSRRYDHRPQDDHMDRITGLCCCPTLKLYASSSLDCTIRIWTAENRLLRLLQLNGAPHALTFCSNNGDLVLALGSRLCLVPHRLYLPTSYLLENLCQEVPDVVDDPPMLLTSQESLTSAQLQRLSKLHGVASLSTALSFIHRQSGAPQQPLLEEDLEALVARDQDLQQLRLGQVAPAALPPPSWQQQQEAFENYLCLIYGPAILDTSSEMKSQQWNTFAVERRTWHVGTLPRAVPRLRKAEVCTKASTASTALPLQDWGALGPHFAHPPQVTLPIQSPHQRVHSKASQLLAHSSLSSFLGLSADLQLWSEKLRQERPVVPDTPSFNLQRRVPLPLERRPKELLSNLKGFFPATVQPYKDLPRPIHFPGWVPNSVVLQQMWLPREVCCPGGLTLITSQGSFKREGSEDDLRLLRGRQQRLIQWLGEEEAEEEEEEEDRELDLDWGSGSPSELSQEPLGAKELWAQSYESMTRRRSSYNVARTESHLALRQHHARRSLWEERYGHLPWFLRFFVIQNWFKNLVPLFSLEAYPETGTVDGLASLFMDLLEEASWADRVHILHGLLRLLPYLGRNTCCRLHGILIYLLNLDQPPSLQDGTQKQFVILALQLVLACSLESREVVLELMSYFLYSPDSCRPELKKLLDGLGLQDPEGFLFKEMMTWAQDLDLYSKAMLRSRCCQKLEEMIHNMQAETLQSSAAKLLEVLPKVSETSALSPRSKETLSQSSTVSGAPIHLSSTPSSFWTPSMVVSPGEPGSAALESQAQRLFTHRGLSETLVVFSSLPDVHLHSSAPDALPDHPLPLELMDWSKLKLLDLGPIDALNFFCEQQRALLLRLLQEEPESPPLSRRTLLDNTVAPQPRHHLPDPILRLQETKIQQRSPVRQRGPRAHLDEPTLMLHCPLTAGQVLLRHWEGRTLDGSIRTLKLPLPRVQPQPFPADWPRPARPLLPLLLQPTLQRYFVPGFTDPDNYS